MTTWPLRAFEARSSSEVRATVPHQSIRQRNAGRDLLDDRLVGGGQQWRPGLHAGFAFAHAPTRPRRSAPASDANSRRGWRRTRCAPRARGAGSSRCWRRCRAAARRTPRPAARFGRQPGCSGRQQALDQPGAPLRPRRGPTSVKRVADAQRRHAAPRSTLAASSVTRAQRDPLRAGRSRPPSARTPASDP